MANVQTPATPSYERVALFGGIYNNYLALEALEQECRKRDVEAIYFLGDIGGFGPHPNRPFPQLRAMSVQAIAGNYDVSIGQNLEDCGCGYSDPRDNRFAQISYDYSLQKTSEANKEWLRSLPTTQRFNLGSNRVLLCHGSPRKINEFLWESTTPDHLLQKFLCDYQTEVLCFTHTGIKWKRHLPGGRLAVNVGAIGRPENDGQLCVWFTILSYESARLQCEFVPLNYDFRRLAREMREEELPEEFAETILSGWWTTCMEIMPSKERLLGRF